MALHRLQKTFEPYLAREKVLVEVGGVDMSSGFYCSFYCSGSGRLAATRELVQHGFGGGSAEGLFWVTFR